jgi:AcrR family transcriptional regulator
MSLILRKGYDAITVQDIIEEADVGRSTFYAHYTGKEDLLRSGFQTLRRELKEAQHAARSKAEGSCEEPLGFSLAMFEHVARYTDAWYALVGGRGGVVVESEIRKVLAEIAREGLKGLKDDAAVPQELRVQFVVSTFFTVLAWWLDRRLGLPAAEVDGMLRRLVLDGIGRPSS